MPDTEAPRNPNDRDIWLHSARAGLADLRSDLEANNDDDAFADEIAQVDAIKAEIDRVTAGAPPKAAKSIVKAIYNALDAYDQIRGELTIVHNATGLIDLDRQITKMHHAEGNLRAARTAFEIAVGIVDPNQ